MEIDLSKVSEEDLPRVKKLLAEVGQHQKYNTRLAVFLDSAYDWQKKAVANTSKYRENGIICGNQMGKSEVACAITACHLTGIYPEWWEGKKFDKPVDILLAGQTSEHNKDVLQDRLFGTDNKKLADLIGTGMIPKDLIIPNSLESERGKEIKAAKIRHISGGLSSLTFRAYSQGRAAAQGVSRHVVVIDEQPNDEFYNEALTRIRATKGHVIISFTPLEGRNALLDKLMLMPAEDDSPQDMFGAKHLTDGTRSLVRASWYDAPHIIDEDPQAVEEAKKDYNSDFEARVYGMPVIGAGRIYNHAEDDITYRPDRQNINKLWDHLIGVDFGWTDKDPSAMVKVAWDKENDVIYVTEEWKGHTPTDESFIKQVNYLDPKLPVIWPRDGSQASDWKGGGTIASKLIDMGLNLTHKPFLNPKKSGVADNNHLDPGFQEINDRLKTNRLKISTDCKKLLTEISSYGYGKDGQGHSTGKPKKNSDDHLCDAFRYAVMSVIQDKGQPIGTNKWGEEFDSLINDEEFFFQTY